MRTDIALSCRGLRRVAFTYLMLPALIFLLGFLRPLPAAVSALALLLIWGFACFGRRTAAPDKTVSIHAFELLLATLAALLWAYLGGQGGFFYQTDDWNERNAIFRDLISYRWPVYYPATDTVLTYYIGHWLPATLVGKAVLAASGSPDAAWQAANIALMVWTTLGVTISFLLLFRAVDARSPARRVAALLIMVLFSGLDIIGTQLAHWDWKNGYLRFLHLEWWLATYQFSSITTCLFWVFNQAVPAWIATLCFLNEPEGGAGVRNYGFILISTLICGPLPCVGLLGLMLFAITHYGFQCLRERRLGEWARNTFSPGNLGMALCVFPVFATYLLSNAAVQGTSKAANAAPAQLSKPGFVALMVALVAVLMAFARAKQLRQRVFSLGSQALRAIGYVGMIFALMGATIFMYTRLSIDYPVFIMTEVGLYLLLLYPFCMDEPLYYPTLLILCVSPLIRVGIASDFCMRASIPPILVLMVLCARFALGQKPRGGRALRKICALLLIAAMLAGSATPLMEIYRGILKTPERRAADAIHTLNKRHASGGIYGNFVSDSYKNSLFFTRLSRLDKGAKR